MSNNYSVTESDTSETIENTYSIFLHIVEGIGFNLKDNAVGAAGDIGDQLKNHILLKASLNGVQFEVEGHSLTHETATIFNSNCIWECELDDVKKMKRDNRPVKLECYWKYGRSRNSPCKIIGSLLLPIRSIKAINNLTNSQIKLYWHKLGTLSAEWRQNRPEIYLMLIIVKKSIIDNGQLEALLGKSKPPTTNNSNRDIMLSPNANVSETAFMLQSQSNVYVQLLEQFGQIQVGNNPDIDCDIFSVTLTFKQIKNVMGLLDITQSTNNSHCRGNGFVFQYDFLGNNSNVEIVVNSNDCYTINEKISLSFRSSLKSLRLYFQRVFYIPINLYSNDIGIANYRFDMSKLLPDDMYFNNNARLWTKSGSFNFDRLHKILSPRALKPLVDFIFTIQLLMPYAKRNNYEIVALNDTFVTHARDDMSQVQQAFKYMPYDDMCLTGRELNGGKIDSNDQELIPSNCTDILTAKALTEHSRNHITENDEIRCSNLEYPVQKGTNTIGVGTENKPTKTFCSIALNTDPCDITDHEELTIKVVHELEEWKSQQMEYFMNELKRKEEIYMKDVQIHWEQHRVILQARLEAKMAKCEQLNAQLEKAQLELSASSTKKQESINIADAIKQEIESNYAKKFYELESEMKRLKLDLQQRGKTFEIKNKQVQIDKTGLEMEKAELKARVEQLERQLTILETTRVSPDKYEDALNDMRKQNERIVAMEKSRNFYKEQWSKATHKVNKLKAKDLKRHEEECERKISKNIGFEFNLEEILNEEREILKSDRSELQSIKLSLLSSSDTSSADEPAS